MNIRRWHVGIGVALFAALSTASMAWATVTGPTLVLGGTGSQLLPSATPGATWLGFSASRPGAPNSFDAYVKQSGQARIKVNTSGVAYAGGIDGTTFIYQHVGFGQSNIALYDFMTPAHSTPSGVNTKAWEWSPSISG